MKEEKGIKWQSDEYLAVMTLRSYCTFPVVTDVNMKPIKTSSDF